MRKSASILLAMVMMVTLYSPALATSAVENAAIVSAVNNIVNRDFPDLEIASYNEWLPLEVVMGEEYAYFIPLKENGNNCGYSVVSYVGGVNKVLKIASGATSAMIADSVIQISTDADTDRIIYVFPDAFLAECNNLFYKICTSGEKELVDKEDYNLISAENFRSSNNNKIREIQRREEIVYGQLDDRTVGEFVPIPKEGGGYYYGGDQDWLRDEGISKFYADRSCGVTAAANMMYYMATHVPGKSALYNQSGSLTKAKFSEYQRIIYDYLDPSIVGVPNEERMIYGVIDYAEECGVSLAPMQFRGTWNFNNVVNFMKTGLNSESPVLVLNWNSPIEELEWHWVTVTQIYSDHASTYMTASTWGERAVYDFNTWVEESSAFKGVVYFV